MYKLYISEINKSFQCLWQKPRQGYVHYNDAAWYESNPVGHHPLEGFMKVLIKQAKLNNSEYTNHSIRATCIGTLDENGFEARHITAISSHKSESTIKTYSTKCPASKKREMYDTLNRSVIPKEPKKIPSATDSTANVPDLPTINPEDVKSLSTSVLCDQDLNTNNSNRNPDLPPTFELMPFDDENDDFLLEYLQKEEAQNSTRINGNPAQMMTTTNNMNTMSTTMPIIPRMYFPNSYVTINYNFNQK